MQITILSHASSSKLLAIKAIRALTDPPMALANAKAFVESLPRSLEVTNKLLTQGELAAILRNNNVDYQIQPDWEVPQGQLLRLLSEFPPTITDKLTVSELIEVLEALR